MFKFFTSVKLTLFLLLSLSVVAVFGTGVPEQAGHYELYFQSLWYRLLLGLLALNLLCCTLKTIRRNLADTDRLHHALEQSTPPLPQTEIESIETLLRQAGFATHCADGRLLARRGRLGRWGSTLVHMALLIIMAGAIIGEAGFVGTINTYLYQVNDRYYDWDAQAELPLGIGLRADSFRAIYYPIKLRFDLLDAGSGQLLESVTLQEGDAFRVSGLDLSCVVRHFEPDMGVLKVEVFRQEQSLGIYEVTAETEKFNRTPNPGFKIVNIEYRDPILKQMETEVSIFLDDRLLQKGQIRVNQPLTIGGVSVYQTAFQYHGDGVWSVGFQLSSDPGEPLVWIGSILLVCGLLVALLVPFRAIGLVRQADGQFGLVVLAGYGDLAGQQRLEQLKDRLPG
ncbi:MAG TPA: cytochrome c biogenesis protein ResB [Malonomonas sp.]